MGLALDNGRYIHSKDQMAALEERAFPIPSQQRLGKFDLVCSPDEWYIKRWI